MKICHYVAVVLTLIAVSAATSADPDDMKPPPGEPKASPKGTRWSQEDTLGPCSAEMWHPEFRADAELKVLITRFGGADGSFQSIQFGQALGVALQRVLPLYVKKIVDADARKTGLRADIVQAKFVPCLLTSHDAARQIGAAWGADLVVWGTAQTTIAQDTEALVRAFERKARDLHVASDNTINAPNAESVSIKGVVNIKVHAPAAGATFRTSMTVVNWQGLEADGSGSRQRTMIDQDFPRLATDHPLALFYLVLGNYAYHTNRFAIAARFFERSTEGVFASTDDVQFLYWIIANSYTYAGNRRGITMAEKALQSCPSDDKRCKALYENNVGRVLRSFDRQNEALEHYARARDLSREENYPYVEATARNNIAALLIKTEPRAAIEELKSVLIIRQRISDLFGEGSTLQHLGSAYGTLGDNKTARDYYMQALSVRRRARDVAGEAETLYCLSSTSALSSNYTDALEFSDQERTVNILLGDKLREFRIELETWKYATDARNDERAKRAAAAVVALLDSVKPLLIKLGDPDKLNTIGYFLYTMDMHDRAIMLYNRSLAIYKARKDTLSEALSYNNIGKALYAKNKYKQALNYYQRSLALIEDKHRCTFYDYLMHNFGLAYAALHDPQRALPYYEEALSLRRHNASRKTVETLMALAAAYGELGRNDNAVANYREASAIALGVVPADRILADRCFELALRLVVQAKRDDLKDSLEKDRKSLGQPQQ